mmetsp:Transcript_21978/g.62626  ORF Transcript_21978/g.62626 Transcript_21978/m.62626 type:complete len:166 (+) Transcript_21978:132-629(+)
MHHSQPACALLVLSPSSPHAGWAPLLNVTVLRRRASGHSTKVKGNEAIRRQGVNSRHHDVITTNQPTRQPINMQCTRPTIIQFIHSFIHPAFLPSDTFMRMSTHECRRLTSMFMCGACSPRQHTVISMNCLDDPSTFATRLLSPSGRFRRIIVSVGRGTILLGLL